MFARKFSISQKNIILFVYVVILTTVCPLIFWLSDRSETVGEKKPRVENHNSQLLSSKTSLQHRISSGEQILIRADHNFDKQAGVEAFAAQNYPKAIASFKASLKTNRNDPETLIYLNNAIAAAQGDSIIIGTSVPIGGSLNVAKEMLRGIAQAQDEINQNGGIKGRLIEVKIANDDNNPKLAQKIARKFVANQKIMAVIGHNSSEASLAAAPIYQEAELVEISPTSVARELPGIGDYILRTTPSTRGVASGIARHTVEVARNKKIAICHDSQSPASQSFKEEFILAIFEYGGEITPTTCDFASSKFNPQQIPSLAVSDGAEALLLIPSVNQIEQAIEVAQANDKRLALLGNHSMYTFETLQQGQLDVNGMVLAVAWHPKLVAASDFLDNAQKLWGGTGTWRTATSYDATKIALMGLEAGVIRQKLQDTLTNPGFSMQGATGEIRFLPSGDRQGKTALVQIQPGNKSKTGYDFSYLGAISTFGQIAYLDRLEPTSTKQK